MESTLPHQEATLPCGLKIIFEPHASRVVHCGFVVKAGTRNERTEESGMAHFLEHISFKGTHRRRACHITNGLERVGGDLNAFTTKQETVYYATVLREDYARAADLLSDIVFHSTYPQGEITKEIEVICDEIESYRDSPSEIIFDEFESLMYPNQPLGRDILGEAERLRTYVTADAEAFARRFYRPENVIFFVYGDLDFRHIVRGMERLLPASDFAHLPPRLDDAQPVAHPRLSGIEKVVRKDTHQAHVLIGAPTFGGSDPRRFALILLNNMLGGPGMNSRLNLSLRERAGLVYSVDSYLNTYPDTGFWNVYFGCDAKDVKRCRRLLMQELRKFIEKPLTPTQLAAAKKQLCGQIGISSESAENYALAMGKTFAHFGTHRDIANLIEALQGVTAEEMQCVAAEVYDESRLTTLIYQ